MASARHFFYAMALAWLLPTAALAQGADVLLGDIRVRGAGIVQVTNVWFHLLGADTFEKDEVCHLGKVPYQCGLLAQAKLAELSTGYQYQCTLREFPGDSRRYGSCLPYDFVTRAPIPGGEDLAKIWVRSGWAWAQRLHTNELVAEEEAARSAKVGLWAGTTPRLGAEPPAQVLGPAFAIDGNSMRVGGVVVRLYGMDAPEGPQSCSIQSGGSYFCGIVARGVLVEFTRGKRILCKIERRQGDDRNWATCGEADAAGKDFKAGEPTLNEQMVRSGWAVADRRANLYLDQQLQADRENIGLWQGPFTTPANWRQGYR